MKSILSVCAALFAITFLAGCEPEIGSDEWCGMIEGRNAEDITAAEAADFTKHCVL